MTRRGAVAAARLLAEAQEILVRAGSTDVVIGCLRVFAEARCPLTLEQKLLDELDAVVGA